MSDLDGVDTSPSPETGPPEDLDALPLLPGRRRPSQSLAADEGEEGGESVEVAGDDRVEQIGEAIFSDTDAQLDDPEGRAELADGIDGLSEGERTRGEAAAIDETLDDLDEDEVLDVEVVAVDPGRAETIVTDDGRTAEVWLEGDEGARLVELGDGDTVLVVDRTLDVGEVIGEAVETQIGLITEVAEGNGVLVDTEALRQTLTQRAVRLAQLMYPVEFIAGQTQDLQRNIDRWVPLRFGEPLGG